MKNIICKLIPIIGMTVLYPGYTKAACIQNANNNKQVTIPNQTIVLQYDNTATGTIQNISVTAYPQDYNPAASGAQDCGGNQYGVYLSPWSVSGGAASSNLAGIAVKAQISTFGNTFFPVNGPKTDQSWIFSAVTWRVEIVKTAAYPQSGVIRSGALARFSQKNTKVGSEFYISTLNFSNNFRINVVSCSLKNPVPVITLGDWYDTQFKNIGDKSTDVDIPITLSCAQGTNVKATITSTGGYVNASQGQLALSGANKATGIAIQIVDNSGKSIPLNTKNTIQNNMSNGDYIFGWKARYIKIANTITPGIANTSATVNIRYE